jgi:hypothetical protein
LRKIFILSILLVFALFGCNKETTSVKENNKAAQEKTTLTTSTDNKNKSTEIDHNQANSKPPLRTDGKWVQLGHRLYYVQGTVDSIKNNDGKEVLNLLVEKTFQSEADGAVSPFNNGKVYSFVIKKDLPDMDFKHKKVIIYGGQVSLNDQDNFIGGMVIYYQLKDKFVDFNGNPATIPPKDYPYQF